ncbi:UNVERIFIED_CONTAM: hypothetical protein Sradi_6224500 [Sesamum radiatum]|uniref:RNase H type-1 domain-containing protein n=1 Tax=Sesamum radiatum TaxID=300843 RepID=A0AAW2KAY9_SESRA
MTASRLGFVLQRPRPSLIKMVKWIPPTDLWFELNWDDTSKGNPRPTGSRGLLQDGHGDMVFAFYAYLDINTNTFAELYAVVHGLEIASDQGI